MTRRGGVRSVGRAGGHTVRGTTDASLDAGDAVAEAGLGGAQAGVRGGEVFEVLGEAGLQGGELLGGEGEDVDGARGEGLGV